LTNDTTLDTRNPQTYTASMKHALLIAGLTVCAAANARAARVLYIGDSHSAQYFGRTLDQDLRSTGDLVATFAVAGSKPSSWTSEAELCMGVFFNVDARLPQRSEASRKNDAGQTCVKTPNLAELLAEYKPDAVIIALGSNGASAAASLLKIVRSDPSKPACFWVGPPHMRAVNDAALDARYSDLAQAGITDSSSPTDSCRLVDSRLSYLRYPAEGCDGIHYNCSDLIPLAKRWGHDVYSAVAGSLSKR
jgi:hypothetical protein